MIAWIDTLKDCSDMRTYSCHSFITSEPLNLNLGEIFVEIYFLFYSHNKMFAIKQISNVEDAALLSFIRLNAFPSLIIVGYTVIWWEATPWSQSQFSAGTNTFPIPLTTPLHAVKHIYYWCGRNHKDTFVYHHRDHYFDKRHTLQDRIESFPLTINPGYSNTFKECNPQKAHTTGCIVVKELKHIHATLEREKKENCISYLSDVWGRKESWRWGGVGY